MYSNYNYGQYGNEQYNMYGNDNDRFIGGGFVFPFLLGGVTGAALAPNFWGGRRQNYVYYPYPYYPYYGPYYR
ncbi:MAG: hypothetical protein IJ565_04960 [Bacilli bacterium]|nr:hypothetical protein [Bacilli bacterium]